MDNIGLMEINEIRPFFTKAFYEIQKLKPAAGNSYDDTYGNLDDRYDSNRPSSYVADFDGKASHSSIPQSSRFQSTQGSRTN